MSNASELMKEFSSKTYLEKTVRIVTSFKEGKITGDDADKIALHLGIDPQDLTSIYEYGYVGSKKLFIQPNITLSQITSNKATPLEKIVLLALELKRNNVSPKTIRDYASSANIDPLDVKNIYIKLEKEVEKLKRAKQEVARVNKGIDEKDMQYTYSALHMHIANLFLYASPAYALALRYHKAEIKYEKKQNFLKYMNKLSNGDSIEEKISQAENGFLNLFLTTIASTRNDLNDMVQVELNQAFTCSKETAESLYGTLKSFRQTINKELADFIAISHQLRPHLEDSDDFLGMGMEMLKGAKIGSLAAVAFGPLGVAVAAGGLFLNGQNKADEAEENFEKITTYWDEYFNSMYNKKLSDYYRQCSEFSRYISSQYIANFKTVETMARQNNTLTEYNEYLQKQLIFFINDENQIQMREDIKVIESIIQ